MALTAYKPPAQSKKQYDITLEQKGNFPFSYVYANTGGGVATDTKVISNNIIITGLFFCLVTDTTHGATAALTASINGVQVAAATVVGDEQGPQTNTCFISLPNWNTSAASTLTTTVNCTAGHGQANITWLGFYK